MKKGGKVITGAVLVIFLAGYLLYSSDLFSNILYNHYPGVTYYHICSKVTRGEKDMIKKLELLADYIHANVYVGDFGVRDWPPLDNLVRGVGWCDQSAHLFLRLVEPLDLRGYLVFLNSASDGTGSSPHSVAVVTPDTDDILEYDEFIKKGVIVDTLRGVLFRNGSGLPANFGDICSGDIEELQKHWFTDNPALGKELYCNKGRAFLSNTPLHRDSRKRRLFYRLFFDFLPDVAFYLYQDITLERCYKKWYPENFAYFRARNYHVCRRFEDAIKFYNEYINNGTDEWFIAKSLFFRGIAYWRMNDNVSAMYSFREMVRRCPRSPWTKLAVSKFAHLERD